MIIRSLALAALSLLLTLPASAADIVLEKHLIPAPAPYQEPAGSVTPDGTFNVRDPAAPFHSTRLADALGLDGEGRMKNGEYLDLNHAIYTAYRLADDDGPVTDVLTLMPGTWAGAMSMDRFARDLMLLMAEHGRSGFQVWLVDRRSEQLEDHTGLWWGILNQDGMEIPQLLQGVSDYYRPAFEAEGAGIELMGRRHVPLNHDAARFMANWGADTAIRDWREVVLAAHRSVGNVVTEGEGGLTRVSRLPGRRVFIGGHSLGGSLTVLYAAYDFDRRPGHELLGQDEVDGLVLLEGGGFSLDRPKSRTAESYRRSVRNYYGDGKVYFDMDMFGIRYAPSTMLSLAISGFAADKAPDLETTFPAYWRPRIVALPHITNAALLGYAIDDDTGAFFIARVSIGHPSGEIGSGGQLRRKIITVPFDPGDCPVVTPWRPGHRPVDPDYLYGWLNIDSPDPAASLTKKCAADDPEVTDFASFARMVYHGAAEYVEAPWMSTGPNDFAEWYFPPRLSMDSGRVNETISESDGTELMNAVHGSRIALPVIAFYGDDSMGEFRLPELDGKNFPPGVLNQAATSVYLMKGYTHLDITAATRNNQPDLAAAGLGDYNGCAAYTYGFLARIAP